MPGANCVSKEARYNLHKPWRASELFGNIDTAVIQLTPAQRSANQCEFWRSVCSEHDARHFYRHLLLSGLALPWKLQEFLPGWLADEVNHARGFKILYRTLYGASFDEMEDALRRRTIEFGHLEEFFADLPSLCLLFAFDELITSRDYLVRVSFYDQLGLPAAEEFIRRLVHDETQHFRAAMKVLVEYCQPEVKTAEAILMRIIDVDVAQDTYRGTFVLDHANSEFPFNKDDLTRLANRGILPHLRHARQLPTAFLGLDMMLSAGSDNSLLAALDPTLSPSGERSDAVTRA
jgi:hypothetical protein